MSKQKLFCALLGLALLGPALAGGQSESLVRRYFRDLESLRADFIQTVYDEQSRLIEASSGRVHMQKPGRFSWDYQEPAVQMVIADGERLWFYDVDLEQVSVKRMDEALATTPMALLSGAAPIDKAFTVGETFMQGGLQWCELRPKDSQGEFKSLWVAFEGDILRTIELEDAFNRRTRLSFEKLERNVDIEPALFIFIPPPGVDIVGDAP